MQGALSQKFDWMGELDRTITASLFTTFGLGFLVFEDKDGGEVDTVHNVRQGIYASEEERLAYEQRGEYDSRAVHQADAFISTKRNLKKQKQTGALRDAYSGDMLRPYANTHTDHVVSGHETHDDAGRVLAELSTEELANIPQNLKEVGAYANLKKSDLSPEEYADKLPEMIKGKEDSIRRDRERLQTMIGDDRRSRHERRKCEDRIRKSEEHLQELKSLNPDKIRQEAKRARQAQNAEINAAYYTSTKFYTNVGSAAITSGVKLGAQQVLGLLFREIWLGLKVELPRIYQECKANFSLRRFFGEIKDSIKAIWKRIQLKFGEWKKVFKESAVYGVLSSIGTTLINMIFSTGKFWVRMIRETIGSIIKAAKLLIFNPEKLSVAELIKEVIKILAIGVATFAGLAVHEILLPFCQFPLGHYVAEFLGAVTAGVLTVGIVFFFDHSSFMKKVMSFMQATKNAYQDILEQYQEINRMLDEKICEYARLEFNLNTEELVYFSDEIALAGTPDALNDVLCKEVQRRNIELPFDPKDTDTQRGWLKNTLHKKK